MSDILKYEVLNPISDKTRPFLKNGVLYIPILEKYKYFVEARQTDNYGYTTYYLLLGYTRFSQHCRCCQADGYNRVKLRLKGEIKEYVEDKCKTEGNVDIEYVESGDGYDVFIVQ